MPSFKKSLIVEQFQGNYIKSGCFAVLRWVYFASLALFNGHLGILRIPLDTISFKANLSQDCVKVVSLKLVNPYPEFTIGLWERRRNGEVSQVKYSC